MNKDWIVYSRLSDAATYREQPQGRATRKGGPRKEASTKERTPKKAESSESPCGAEILQAELAS
jgi:hypothetical protein